MGKSILCEFTLDAIEGLLKHYGIWNLLCWESHTHTSSLFTLGYKGIHHILDTFEVPYMKE